MKKLFPFHFYSRILAIPGFVLMLIDWSFIFFFIFSLDFLQVIDHKKTVTKIFTHKCCWYFRKFYQWNNIWKMKQIKIRKLPNKDLQKMTSCVKRLFWWPQKIYTHSDFLPQKQYFESIIITFPWPCSWCAVLKLADQAPITFRP